MKMELIEDIGYTQLSLGHRCFSELESVEFQCCLAIEKLKNVAVTSLMPYFALMYSSFKFKIMLIYCEFFFCYFRLEYEL